VTQYQYLCGNVHWKHDVLNHEILGFAMALLLKRTHTSYRIIILHDNDSGQKKTTIHNPDVIEQVAVQAQMIGISTVKP